MGTTLTAILFAGSRLGLVHVGDSRAYQLRDGALTQITKDDTFVQSLIDEGRITEEEAHTHPQRSLLLRALTGQDVDPSLTIREARAGDRYLLCSDGLSGVVSDETLADTLRAYRDPRECADRMIELALRGGGPDNITCIVADVVDIDFGEDAPIMGGSVGDGSEDDPPPDSAAARASATTLTRTAPHRVGRRRPRRPPDPAAARTPAGGRPARRAGRAGRRRARWPGSGSCSSTSSAPTPSTWRSSRACAATCSGLPLHRVDRAHRHRADRPPGDRAQPGPATGIIASDGLDDARRLVDRLRARCSSRARCRPRPRRPRWCRRRSRRRSPRRRARRWTRPNRPRGHHARCRRRAARARDDLPAGELMAATDQRVRDRRSRPRAAAAHRPGHRAGAAGVRRVLVTGALVLVEANQEQELTPALLYVGRGLPGPVHRARTSRCASSRPTPTR